MFEVVIETANREVRHVRCLNANCGVGKSGNNLVVLQGWDIADDHAAFRARPDGVFMEVLGGRAPVTVNGQRIAHRNAAGPLRKEDIVAIGAYRLRVLADAPSAAMPDNPPQRPKPANSAPPVAHEPKVTASSTAAARAGGADATLRAAMLEWRLKVHASLVRQMDLRRVDVRGMNDDELRVKTSELIEDIIAREFADLPPNINRRRLAKEVLDEAIGLGPLEDLIGDESVTEVMV